MNSSYYVGSYKQDSLDPSHHGWIVGSFMDEVPRKNAEVEIKYWEFTKGDNGNHDTKVSAIFECTMILKGKLKAIVDDQELELNAGDYVVIQPGVPNNLVLEVIEDSAGITIKAPSDPMAKQVID